VADVLLCTVSSQQGVPHLRSALRRANKRAAVVLGGGACYAPAVFDGLATVACVGEGAEFVRTLLSEGIATAMQRPESWVPGETRRVVPNDVFPWDAPPIMNTDGFVRVFGARGCRYKCLFCETGWESSYRTNPDPERLQRQIRRLLADGRKVVVVTNDGAEGRGILAGQQEFLSVRLRNLQRLMPLTRAQVKGVRIGVEGVLERLRVALGKPVPDEDLLRVTYDLAAAGIGVRWFFVVGLPCEQAQDYEGLRHLVAELHNLPKGAVMMNFHAFIPQPAAPLCMFPLRDDYWEPFDEFRRWFFHGPGGTRRVQIVAPCRYPGRLERACDSMAATEDELRRGWWDADNANWRVCYQSPPAQMREIARVYARKLEATC